MDMLLQNGQAWVPAGGGKQDIAPTPEIKIQNK
jgi:hypothetical protein